MKSESPHLPSSFHQISAREDQARRHLLMSNGLTQALTGLALLLLSLSLGFSSAWDAVAWTGLAILLTYMPAASQAARARQGLTFLNSSDGSRISSYLLFVCLLFFITFSLFRSAEWPNFQNLLFCFLCFVLAAEGIWKAFRMRLWEIALGSFPLLLGGFLLLGDGGTNASRTLFASVGVSLVISGFFLHLRWKKWTSQLPSSPAQTQDE